MHKVRHPLVLLNLILAGTALALCQTPAGTMAFTVSMDRPNTHYYHVVFRCDGLAGESQDFKMPVWMPGYYRIMDYSKDVVNFRPMDGARNELSWTKIDKNTWRVRTGSAPHLEIAYDVYAYTRFVANNFLDGQRGYFVGPGLYMYVAGMIHHPVTVTINPYPGWTSIATGLEPVPGRPNTFSASDFDLLYDCPTLLGNQEHHQFEVNGIPHNIVAEDVPIKIDRNKIAADLKKIVTTATQMMGDIPYKHYTFLLMGRGVGGVEHLTSAAMLFDGESLATPEGYRRWLSFAAHEYFHTYNVKRIRPVALGPFDYDRENYTTMLWVSEGFTSYYADLILRRAGLTTQEQYLDSLTRNISAYENSSGRLFQSAAQSSIDTWIRGENAANTTISYYNKGPAIAAMLDFTIRSKTKNRASLDDVMRALYKEYFQQKGRGFTDAEFREVCERIAGAPLREIFDDYVATTKEIDYRKYFALAGLNIDTELRAQPGPYLGAVMDTGGRGAPAPNRHLVARVEYDSPAEACGLSPRDEILAIDGISLGARSVDELLKNRKPAETIKILISRENQIRELEAVLGSKGERSFKIEPAKNPAALQAEILSDWLKD